LGRVLCLSVARSSGGWRSLGQMALALWELSWVSLRSASVDVGVKAYRITDQLSPQEGSPGCPSHERSVDARKRWATSQRQRQFQFVAQ
jgi:hypothetical protein